MPFLKSWAEKGKLANINPVIPAVTTTVQATYLTGKMPSEHGIVGNGWFFKDLQEIKFWHQSNQLVTAPKIWEIAKQIDPNFTCANICWWYNMYSSVDYSVTPRPQYFADGRKAPDCYTHPAEWRDELQNELGTFPLFDFWGPRTNIKSSSWIAEAAKKAELKYNPTLSLVYLPHLDYNFQRLGKGDAKTNKDLMEIDQVLAGLIPFYEAKAVSVIVLSEYGITTVSKPIHLNRVLRLADPNFIAIRKERGFELLDPGASNAFAVADHQIAHVYVRKKEDLPKVKSILEATDGVAEVWSEVEKTKHGLNNPRSGDFVVLAKPDAWFTYYYWLDDVKAPDFARIVEIHRKPGYDPVELFANPKIPLLPLKVIYKLLKKKLGFRMLMDVISLDATLVRGSHGLYPSNSDEGPLFITSNKKLLTKDHYQATDVFSLILNQLQS